jgi:hypothetical protein
MKTKPLLTFVILSFFAFQRGAYSEPAKPPHTAAEAIASLPKPEDPVVVPTDEQIAELVKNMRESNLRMLKCV